MGVQSAAPARLGAPSSTATLAVSKVTTYYLEAEVLEGDGSGKVTVLTGQVTFTPTSQNG